MNSRILVLIGGPALLAGTSLVGQATKTKGAIPRTPDGHPDLQGVWTNATLIVTDTATGAVLGQQNYTCVTTRNPDNVSCTLVQ